MHRRKPVHQKCAIITFKENCVFLFAHKTSMVFTLVVLIYLIILLYSRRSEEYDRSYEVFIIWVKVEGATR